MVHYEYDSMSSISNTIWNGNQNFGNHNSEWLILTLFETIFWNYRENKSLFFICQTDCQYNETNTAKSTF